jgi:hypothetical protein
MDRPVIESPDEFDKYEFYLLFSIKAMKLPHASAIKNRINSSKGVFSLPELTDNSFAKLLAESVKRNLVLVIKVGHGEEAELCYRLTTDGRKKLKKLQGA